MALTQEQVVAQARILLEWRRADAVRLNRLYQYIHGWQQFVWLSADIPVEVQRIAEMSRVNVLGLAVDSAAQSLYVDGYRSKKEEDEDPAWLIWQQNRFDARQIGVHRAAGGYGVAYTLVLPGNPVPVMRGYSPRNMTVLYGEDDDWPMWALERRRSDADGKILYRLFDDENMYWCSATEAPAVTPYSARQWPPYPYEPVPTSVEYVSTEEHGCGLVPVVRFLAKMDLDEEVVSPIQPLMALQDQIDLTTFGLLVVQHYGAFPQKWIAGWMAESSDEELKVGASKILTFEDADTKLGQFAAASLDGYIQSRRDAMKNLASIAQMSEQALRGELINLSAEALEAAKDSERRKNTEMQKTYGESWEQTLELAGVEAGFTVDPSAEVRWKDMEMRSFSATVDALGKMAQMLGIPKEEIWERVPGVTPQEIARWKAAKPRQGDSFARTAPHTGAAGGDTGSLVQPAGSRNSRMARTEAGTALTQAHMRAANRTESGHHPRHHPALSDVGPVRQDVIR